jgi:hypothetical protein
MMNTVMWLIFDVLKLSSTALVKILGCCCLKVGILKILLVVARQFLGARINHVDKVFFLQVILLPQS